MKKNCKHCDTEFTYYPSQRTRGNYCSRECHRDTMCLEAMENDPSFANGQTYMKRFVEYKCSTCGINEWNDKPLRLQVDHIDGNRKNNVKENLRYLCANCHTQTETWGQRNISEEGKKRMLAGASKGGKIIAAQRSHSSSARIMPCHGIEEGSIPSGTAKHWLR